MKTRTFEVEVVSTSTVLVTLPEAYEDEQLIKDWERGLWPIPNGMTDIAEYAARMAVYSPSSNHDGVGQMITSKHETPDYEKHKYQVVAIVTDEDIETETKEITPA